MYKYDPQLFDILIIDDRMFIFFSNDKYVSAYFPFHFNKTSVIFHYDKFLINQKTISHLKSLNECIEDKKTMEEAFTSCNSDADINDEEYISNEEKEIMTKLLKLESCYMRYDFDVKNANGLKHPLIHLDINFSKGGSWKFGLHDRITPLRFMQMFDKKTDCEFLEDGIIGKNDRKRVIYNLIKSLQCKLGQ